MSNTQRRVDFVARRAWMDVVCVDLESFFFFFLCDYVHDTRQGSERFQQTSKYHALICVKLPTAQVHEN